MDDPEEQARRISRAIAQELAAVAPSGWQRLTAVFALTATAGTAEVRFSDGERSVSGRPPASTVELARHVRELAAGLSDGPWLRMILTLEADGSFETDYDYGDEPVPTEHLLPPEAYRADLAAYPRPRVPTWLGAYADHGGRQLRMPRQAAQPTEKAWRTTGELAPLRVLWARWTMLAVVRAARGSEAGPAVLPSLGWFESDTRSGATLYLLSGGRAVLSGGVADSPELAAAYNGERDLPDLFAGAPSWVSSTVLNPRSAGGLLSFCYWFERGSWRMGESPDPGRVADALPPLWTDDQVLEYVTTEMGVIGDPVAYAAAEGLLVEAEHGLVTRDSVAALFEADHLDTAQWDADAAFFQFDVAGVAATLWRPLPAADAVAVVRDHIVSRGLESPGYPVSQLVASRLEVGWMVHVPPPDGQVMRGRAVFYVADDGELERSSSATPPAVYAIGFAERFQQRLAVQA
ncbi:MAG: hypothetical protein HOQ24_17205 [Mycobacteriaceae bacterium]|nr:hypothetical protein [Mycobacteriaceae bacterium]